MTNTALLCFLLAQSAFTVADIVSVWQESGRPSLKKIFSEHGGAVAGLLIFWSLFFVIQWSSLKVMPALDSGFQILGRMLGLKESATANGALATGFASAAHETHLAFAALAVAALVFVYFTVSFWDYATHRFVLHRKFFWFLHEYHHLPVKVFNGMPGISVRPFVFATTLLTFGGTFATIIPVLRLMPEPALRLFIQWVPAEIMALTLVLSIGHSHFLRRFHFVHRAMILTGIATPQEHLLHHSRSKHCNYGNFSCLWDRWFGTYISPDGQNIQTEVLGLSYDQDFMGTLTWGKVKLPAAVREKLQVNQFCYNEPVRPDTRLKSS